MTNATSRLRVLLTAAGVPDGLISDTQPLDEGGVTVTPPPGGPVAYILVDFDAAVPEEPWLAYSTWTAEHRVIGPLDLGGPAAEAAEEIAGLVGIIRVAAPVSAPGSFWNVEEIARRLDLDPAQFTDHGDTLVIHRTGPAAAPDAPPESAPTFSPPRSWLRYEHLAKGRDVLGDPEGAEETVVARDRAREGHECGPGCPVGDAAVEEYKRSGREVLTTLDGRLSPERDALVRAQAHSAGPER